MPEEKKPRILDVGCGRRKQPGAIGVDKVAGTDADVLCDLDRGGLPFADNSFDQVRAIHIVEHTLDLVKTIEEFHRVTRPGGTLYIVTPHYTDFISFTDPTHRWHLSSLSFRYFYPGGLHGRNAWYSRVQLRERRLKLKLARLWKPTGLELLVNWSRGFRRIWELYLCYVIRGKEMEFEFEVLK